MGDEQDAIALANLRKQITEHNAYLKDGMKRDKTGYFASQPRLRVKLQFRRPELNHPHSRGTKYGWGGSVRSDQKPKEADVYVYAR